MNNIDYNTLYSFFQFKHRKIFEYAERKITQQEFIEFVDMCPPSHKALNKFVEDTNAYNEFIVYNDIGFMSGSAGIKTPDGKFCTTFIRS